VILLAGNWRAEFPELLNPADDATIIDPMGAASATRHQGLDPFPLRIGKPIELRLHQGLHRTGNIESQLSPSWNPY
jgi:hypothetical protein